MCVNFVIERFALISGLSGEEISNWFFLCSQACDYIEQLRADGTDPDDRRLISAAAVYAYYLYCRYACDDVESFKAGDVEVSRRLDMLERAEEMWNRERTALKGVINSDSDDSDGAFCFFRM